MEKSTDNVKKEYNEIRKRCKFIKLEDHELKCEYMEETTALYVCNFCEIPETNLGIIQWMKK